MGAAISSNVVSAVSQVTNDIQTLTSASSDQNQTCQSTYNLDECIIRGGFDATETCNIVATSSNIISQVANNNLNNQISQKLLQEAQSTVGALGLGFAEANNTANAFVGSTNNIVNSVSSSANQNSQSIKTFNCRGGTIIDGGVKLNTTSDANFLSQQVLQNNATNQVVNNISQDITQKATATVEGLTGMLLALAVLIVAIGWVLFRPLQLALSNKIVVILIVVLIILSLLLAAFLLKWPPFFNPPTDCIATTAAIGKCAGSTTCVDATPKTIQIPNPPIRYSYNIIGQGDSTVDPQNPYVPGLLQMAIANRKGWTKSAYDYFQTNLVPLGVPNPLVEAGSCPNVQPPPNPPCYNTNVTAWQTYIDISPQNVANARYVLSRDLSIDTYARIYDYESCTIDGTPYAGADGATKCYKFTPDTAPTNLQSGINTGGTITGQFGYCDTTTYSARNYLKIGGLVLLGILLLVFIIFAIKGGNSKSKGTTNAQMTTKVKTS